MTSEVRRVAFRVTSQRDRPKPGKVFEQDGREYVVIRVAPGGPYESMVEPDGPYERVEYATVVPREVSSTDNQIGDSDE